MPYYNGKEYEYSLYDPETGKRSYYDSDGNVVATQSGDDAVEPNRREYTGRRGPGNEAWNVEHGTDKQYDSYDYDPETGVVTYYREDPVTGETESWSNRNLGKNDRQRDRDVRRSDRDAEQQRQNNRALYFAEGARTANDRIDDPWNELEGNLPSYADLMGDEYTSTLGEASADPMAVAAQRAALQRMGQVARTGYTAEDRAIEQQARANAAQYERQQRDAVMQNAAMRGMAGAGTTLGAQLAAQQAGANRNSQASLDMAANAQRRALQALAMQNSAAGQMRGQSFNEDTTRRSAVDEANRYMIDGQRAASRDQFGMRRDVAAGQSTAAQSQRDHNAGMYQYQQGRIDGTKGKDEKAMEWTETVSGFF